MTSQSRVGGPRTYRHVQRRGPSAQPGALVGQVGGRGVELPALAPQPTAVIM